MSRAGEHRDGEPGADNAPAVHLLIPTHTTRHLAPCLAAIAWQREMPATVVVTCDTDDPSIGTLLAEWWPRVGGTVSARGMRPPRLLHTFRAHQGEARLNQVRNNGLRALDRDGVLRDEDLIVVIDGDMVLDELAVLRHRGDRALGVDLVIPYRVNLSEAETGGVSAGVIIDHAARCPREGPAAGAPFLHGAVRRTMDELARRERRYRRQLWMRRFTPAFIKAHKPKILGGHHGVSVRTLRAINGYDDAFVGYGYDDDDLSRRVYALRPAPRTAIAVEEIRAFHLWHPTRAPGRPTDSPNYERFRRRDLPSYAERGWQSPADQPAPTVRIIAPNA
jgi:hypothetical protein